MIVVGGMARSLASKQAAWVVGGPRPDLGGLGLLKRAMSDAWRVQCGCC